MKYFFPAIFAREENDLYSVRFPDIEGCYTSGDGLADAYANAEDVMIYCLYDLETGGEIAPAPSNPSELMPPKEGFVAVIGGDTEMYRRMERNRSVKKTLSIPEWLDERAKAANINYSHVLQEGLKRELHISEG